MLTVSLFILLFIHQSLQDCKSTVGVTTCSSVRLENNQPLKIDSYKNYVAIENSNLKRIPQGYFRFLTNVVVLQLSNNKITSVEVGAFDGLSNLKDLTLYNNQLESVKAGMFRGSPNLKILDMGMNKIINIDDTAFTEVPAVEKLNLAFNQLTKIPKAVNNLKSLKALKLYNNKIERLEANDFKSLGSLEILNLSDNNLKNIQVDAFNGLARLRKLHLNTNYLSDLNVNDVLGDLRSLAVIKLNINSFNCQKLRDIVRKFQEKSVEVSQGHSKSKDNVNGMTCQK